MNTNIEATPTEFNLVKYRSKSEAMFAAALVLCGRTHQFLYEPKFLRDGEWIVDFALPKICVVEKVFSWIAIEYKPIRPTDTYLENLSRHFINIRKQSQFAIQAWCVWIDWYSMRQKGVFNWGAMLLVDDAWEEQVGSYTSTTPQVLPVFERAYPQEFVKIANMRFDLSEFHF